MFKTQVRTCDTSLCPFGSYVQGSLTRSSTVKHLCGLNVFLHVFFTVHVFVLII